MKPDASTAAAPKAPVFLLLAMVVCLILACSRKEPERQNPLAGDLKSEASEMEPRESQLAELRRRMVERQLAARGVADPRVLAAMGKVPRHRFVSKELQEDAYGDHPLPIGFGQTISQPYIVALMTELVRPQPEDRALDVGGGSGYQAAILAELCREVYSIEIVQPLAEQAQKRLASLGYANVEMRHGDGYRGWPEKAPFDVIVVAAAPDHLPPALVEQLAPGGRLVIPVGEFWQELTLVEKDADGKVRQSTVAPVAFVPMTGEAQRE